MSIYAEKAFKNATSYYNKNSQQMRWRKNVHQHKKAIYGKPTAKIIFDSENLKAFPLRSEKRLGCPISHSTGNTSQNN